MRMKRYVAILVSVLMVFAVKTVQAKPNRGYGKSVPEWMAKCVIARSFEVYGVNKKIQDVIAYLADDVKIKKESAKGELLHIEYSFEPESIKEVLDGSPMILLTLEFSCKKDGTCFLSYINFESPKTFQSSTARCSDPYRDEYNYGRCLGTFLQMSKIFFKTEEQFSTEQKEKEKEIREKTALDSFTLTGEIPAEYATLAIKKLEKDSAVKILGDVSGNLREIIDAVKELNVKVDLDFSSAVGLSLEKFAFRECNMLRSFVIPDGTTEIGYGAFSSCKVLESVFIPNSVKVIEKGAFAECESLKSIAIPAGVSEIAPSTFYGCASLSVLKLPNSVVKIGADAFYGCSSLSDFSIPKSVREFDIEAFVECVSLKKVEIPNGVSKISDALFGNCVGLKEVFVPDSVTVIGEQAFFGCSMLDKIHIPDGVVAIGSLAFHGCASLTDVTIPDSVKSVGVGAFRGCMGLSSISVPAGLDISNAHIPVSCKIIKR